MIDAIPPNGGIQTEDREVEMSEKERYLFLVLDFIEQRKFFNKTLAVDDLIMEMDNLADECCKRAPDEKERSQIQKFNRHLTQRVGEDPFSGPLEDISYYDMRDILVNYMEKALGSEVVKTTSDGLKMVLNPEDGRVSMFYGDETDFHGIGRQEALKIYEKHFNIHGRDNYNKEINKRFIRKNVKEAPQNTMILYSSDQMLEIMGNTTNAVKRGDAAEFKEKIGIFQVGNILAALSFKPGEKEGAPPGVLLSADIRFPFYPDEPSPEEYYQYGYEMVIDVAYSELKPETIAQKTYEGILSAKRAIPEKDHGLLRLYRACLTAPTKDHFFDRTTMLHALMKKEPFLPMPLENATVYLPSWAEENPPVMEKESAARKRKR